MKVYLIIEDASGVRSWLQHQEGADTHPGLHFVMPLQDCARADAQPPLIPDELPGSTMLPIEACCCLEFVGMSLIVACCCAALT